MKILRLTLCNLTSLEGEHVIDFEAEPLASSGLIAITGKTGSGKSTVLDALCLALFDQVPRFQEKTGGIVDSSGVVISFKDSKHLLRRGCIHAFSEVEFIALDQKRYCTRWEIRRTYKKLDGKLKLERFVRCLDEGTVLTQKISECTPLIQQLIGLNFEQFTRAVLLAQSQIGAFLKASDAEKAELLEYLTNSTIFSLISQLSFQKTKHYKDELEQLKQVTGYIELLSPEELDQLHQQLYQQQQQIEQHQHQLKQYEQAQQWFKQHNDLKEQQQRQRQLLEQHLSQQANIEAERVLLAHLDQFSEIRPQFEQQHRTNQQLEHARSTLQPLQHSYAQAEQQLQQKLVHSQQQTQQLKQHKLTLQQLQPALAQALACDTQIQQLRQTYQTQKQQLQQIQTQRQQQQLAVEQQQQTILQAQQALQQHQAQLQQSQHIAPLAQEPKANLEQLAQLLQHWHSIQTDSQYTADFDIAQFSAQQQQAQQQFELYQQRYGTLTELEQQLQQLQQQHKQQQQLHFDLQPLARLIEQIIQHSAQIQRLNQQIADTQLNYQKQQQQQQQAQQHLSDCEHRQQQLQDIFNEQRLLQREDIEQLRAQLKDQQPCPVCGSEQHPFIQQHALLENALQRIQQAQLQQAQLAKQQAQQQLAVFNQHVTQSQTTLDHLQQQLSEQTTVLAQDRQQLQQHSQKAAITWHTEDIQQIQQQFLQQYQLEQQQLDQLEQQLSEKQQQLTTLKTDQQQQHQQQQLLDKIQQYQHTEQLIFAQLPIDWQRQWLNQRSQNAKACIQQFQQQILARVQMSQQLESLHHNVEQQHHALQPLQTRLEMTQQQEAQCQQQLEHTRELGQQSKQQLDTLMAAQQVNYPSVKAWQTALAETTLQREQQAETAQSHYQQAQQQLQQQQQQLTHLNSQIALWQQQLDEINKQQHDWQTQHDDFDEALIACCLAYPSTDIQSLRQRIQQFEQRDAELCNHLTWLTQQLSQHAQLQPQLSNEQLATAQQQLKQQLVELNQDKDRIAAQLLSQQERSQRLQKYQQQMNNLQQQINRWGKISSLIGQSDGKKFQRIAQEHHLDILVEYANQQLIPLAPRYQLQRIPDSLALAVIDQDMNGEIRPVLSLSGGETFLVSLALSLALANMASGNMKLESLFIDEGFGSLDPNSLHIAMDALDRLQHQGRKVILISHVQEMHERIPVQIQVKPIGTGASRIYIVG